MSNQFFKEIATIIIDFFKENRINKGDRYYLQLDTVDDVLQLVEALKNNNTEIKPFKYKHERGDEYKTFAINFDEIDLVVAYTSENVKPDFLVTLRNLVGEQQGDWRNTALLSIVSEQLDSIQGGSSDLQKEGMPLHPLSIYDKLKKRIEDSSLNQVEKIILQNNLDFLKEDYVIQKVTFYEFSDIMTIINKGKIDDIDYQKFGLFKDPDLVTFNGKAQQKRLKENRDLFDFIKKVHEFGKDEEELEKKFSPKGVKELLKDNWEALPYSTVLKYHEDLKSSKRKKVKFLELTIKEKLSFWDKPASETAAGRRKRHIIIFNPEMKEKIELQFSFDIEGDKSLSSDFLKIDKSSKKHLNVQVKLTNIYATISNVSNTPIFAKFSYKHDNKASLGAEFLIAVLPINPLHLETHKSTYLVNPRKNCIEIHFDNEELIFGYGVVKKEVELIEENQIISMSNNESLKLIPLPDAFNENDESFIKIQFEKIMIPFLLKNELPDSTPISGQRIWKLIRESGKDMEWIKENNRLILGNREFYFHSEYKEFFNWELEWIENGLKCAKFESDRLQPINIELSDSLREAYSRFLTYFNSKRIIGKICIPSLCSIDEELKKRSFEYINEYRKEIESFKDGIPAGKKGRDLFKLGTIQANERIYFTPFHPLMVAFKLKVYELLQKEEIDNSILNRLTPDGLIPFIYDEHDILYKPDHQRAAMDWMVFKPVNRVTVSDASQFLAKVVYDKIVQFKKHFSYLFIENSGAPLHINIINISNDMEVLRGILQYMLYEINSVGVEQLKPIEITLYNQYGFDSAFDSYARTDNVIQFQDLFDIKLKAKDLDANDVLRAVRSKLSFYKQDINKGIRYAHITFYKMHAQEHHAVQRMNEMRTGIAIEGIYSSVPSMKDKENYKSGFGIKCYTLDHSEKDYLVSTAYFVNELAGNLRNGGNDSYRKGEAIFSRTTTTDEQTLNRIFDASHWVTFVAPPVDLEFFQKFDNLVIIHYSDQYSSSSRYDAITVTNKYKQYYAVIKEFLNHKNVDGNKDNVINTIKAFNTFNGEWLLRIIGSKGYFDREKLSILSAIKFSLSYFDHPNILWVPISLEEILRVAGAVGLNKSDGVFTPEKLGVKGNHSDDLLLLGLENLDQELKIHFYPVEVKIGFNRTDIINKAKKQVKKTKKLIIDKLTGEFGKTFKGRFYRNFFVQLFISNARKLHQGQFWVDRNYDLEDEIIEKLLKDNYRITNELNQYIGEGAILSFQKDLSFRSAYLEDDVLILNFTERDGFEGLVKPIEDIRQWIQDQENDFIKEDLISRRYKPDEIKINLENEKSLEREEYQETIEVNPINISETLDEKEEIKFNEPLRKESFPLEVEKNTSDTFIITEKNNNTSLKDVRILIGTAENSNRKIYWEYGNPELANRHLLITGKSGQGKTYFLQCLIIELSKHGIPTIVIDYTEGFLPNQLEPEFVGFLGDKLKQIIVYSRKMPINPFSRNVRDIGGIELPESNNDIAERVKSVFSAVYKSLGIQQQNAIYEAVLKGLEQHGDQMNLAILKKFLEEDGSNYAKTALSQIRPLIDRNPFDSEKTIDWKNVIESDGKVYIIQLTGFPRDVQLIIAEFILWDLWNYSIRNGNKNKPIPVVLDEAQNLDHTEKSPSARILQEGRKFGWSAWYSTQFLKAQLTPDELARVQMASQKVYFSPPEQEIPNIVSGFSKDASERRFWERKLALLKKGQCVVHGPIRGDDGQLTQPTKVVVNVSPLSERI